MQSRSANYTAPAATVSPPRRTLLICTLLYAGFMTYGSLVPLEFTSLQFDEAWALFRRIISGDPAYRSRSDWAANILLGMPLGFFMLGTMWPTRGVVNRILTSLLVLGICFAISHAIEFLQLFVPMRSPTRSDIIAQGIGAAVGVVGWWWLGASASKWYYGWRTARTDRGIADHLLWIYLVFLFGYNVLPLDLTISPVELYHKWKSGHITLVPFTYPIRDTSKLVYNFATDVLIWAPVSLLWVVSGRKTPPRAWLWAVGAAAVLECVQLLVFSRITDTTDIVLAMVGATLGIWFARWWRPRSKANAIQSAQSLLWVGLGGAVVWMLVLLVLFWYPFNFRLERSFILQRIELLTQVPLQAYFYSTEYRAITGVMRRIVLFLPLGIALGLSAIHIKGVGRSLFHVGAILLIAGAAFIIEFGQLALPDKKPDSVDWFFELLGGVGGYVALVVLAKRAGWGRNCVSANATAQPNNR